MQLGFQLQVQQITVWYYVYFLFFLIGFPDCPRTRWLQNAVFWNQWSALVSLHVTPASLRCSARLAASPNDPGCFSWVAAQCGNAMDIFGLGPKNGSEGRRYQALNDSEKPQTLSKSKFIFQVPGRTSPPAVRSWDVPLVATETHGDAWHRSGMKCNRCRGTIKVKRVACDLVCWSQLARCHYNIRYI